MPLLIVCGLAHVQPSCESGKMVVDVVGEDLPRMTRAMTDKQQAEVAASLKPANLSAAVYAHHREILVSLSNAQLLDIARMLPTSVIRVVAREVGNAVYT